MAVSKRLRFEILRRDNHACRYCGGVAPDVTLTVDHVIPVALGGSDDPSNLVAACRDCNAGKSSVAADEALVADVESDALRWGQAMKFAAQVQAAERQIVIDRRIEFDNFWCGWTFVPDGDEAPRPSDWERSIDQFYAAGATDLDLKNAAYKALVESPRVSLSGTWRYFCGVLWSTLRERQEIARGYLDAEDGAHYGA